MYCTTIYSVRKEEKQKLHRCASAPGNDRCCAHLYNEYGRMNHETVGDGFPIPPHRNTVGDGFTIPPHRNTVGDGSPVPLHCSPGRRNASPTTRTTFPIPPHRNIVGDGSPVPLHCGIGRRNASTTIRTTFPIPPHRSPREAKRLPQGQCRQFKKTFFNAVGRGLGPAGAFASGKSTKEYPNSDYCLVYDIAPAGCCRAQRLL